MGAGPLDRLARQTEVRAFVLVDIPTTSIRSLRAEQRHRSREALDAPFVDRSAELGDLVGRPLMSGFGPALVQRFASEPDDAPFLDAVLNLAPGYVQCVAAVTDLFLPGGRHESAGGLGAWPDSCFMWRSGGALQSRLASAEPSQAPATPRK